MGNHDRDDWKEKYEASLREDERRSGVEEEDFWENPATRYMLTSGVFFIVTFAVGFIVNGLWWVVALPFSWRLGSVVRYSSRSDVLGPGWASPELAPIRQSMSEDCPQCAGWLASVREPAVGGASRRGRARRVGVLGRCPICELVRGGTATHDG